MDGIFKFICSLCAIFAVLAILLRLAEKRRAEISLDTDVEDDVADTAEESVSEKETAAPAAGAAAQRLILNTNSKILHTDEACRALRHIQAENRTILEQADPATLVALGYTVCGICASELRK